MRKGLVVTHLLLNGKPNHDGERKTFKRTNHKHKTINFIFGFIFHLTLQLTYCSVCVYIYIYT